MSSSLEFITGLPVSQAPLPRSVVAVYPMTKAQRGLWNAYTLDPAGPYYNLTFKLSFPHHCGDSKASLEKISTVINILTRRHAMLRATFHPPAGERKTPFVAEHDPNTAVASLLVVQRENTALDSDVLTLVRNSVPLSDSFAARWVVILSPNQTDLYFVVHHIAIDGISLGFIATEVTQLLNADDIADTVAKLPARKSFSGAHILEIAFEGSQEFKDARNFWIDQLRPVQLVRWKHLLPEISLPSQNYREQVDWFELPKEDLSAWGNLYGMSWFRLAVTVIGLLARGHSDIDFGSDHAVSVAVAGRGPGMEQTVGHFANGTPIRIPFSDAVRSTGDFKCLAKLVAKQVSSAKRYERFTYSHIEAECSAPGRPIPRTQIAVSLCPVASVPNIKVSAVEGAWDLFFVFVDSKNTVSLSVIYDPLVFSSADISIIKDEFTALYDLTRRDMSMVLSELTTPDIKTQIPRLLLNVDLNNKEYIDSQRFHRWFECQANHAPDRIALHSAELRESVTYGELNASSNRIAYYLHSVGVGPGAVVMLYLPRGFSTIEWIIGVLKAGAAFTISDQDYPLDRLRAIITLAQPTLIVHDFDGERISSLASECGVNTVDAGKVALDQMPEDSFPDQSSDEDLAYIIFTSGSTGQPKGVEIEHRNLSHLIADSGSSHFSCIGPGTNVLQFFPLTFDGAVCEYAPTLALGGTLCFAAYPSLLVGDYLADVIDSNKISWTTITPSVLATVPISRSLSTIRTLAVAGEALPESLIQSWGAKLELQNAYGPTECTVVVASQPQTSSPYQKAVQGNALGRFRKHTTIYVCDERFTKVLPSGQIGELCVGGSQVGRGYRGREDLTQSRFAVHPTLKERLYRTGDKAKFLPDGSLALLGRMDREVKIRGFRVSLPDIEQTICTQVPEVDAVSVLPDSAGTSLVAFLSPKSVDVEVVRSRLSTQLPSYMVPSVIYSLTRLPLSQNGKVDHKVIQKNQQLLMQEARSVGNGVALQRPLPVPTASATQTTQKSQSFDAIERKIKSIWEQVLGFPIPSSDAKFFDIGGHSLGLLKVLDAIHTEWPSVKIAVTHLFQHSTIKSQATLIRGLSSAQSEQHIEPPQTAVVEHNTASSEIAIVGIAGRFPGASDPDELYQLFVNREEAYTRFPEAKTASPNNRVYVDQKGALKDPINADLSFCKMTDAEARSLEPQERLFIETANKAIQDAGIAVARDRINRVGVFVGSAPTTWQSEFADPTSNLHASTIISSRTAYHLNLHGPNVSLYTACSSGLVAMSVAVDNLKSGQCDAAIAGGVSIEFPQQGYFSGNGLNSPSGHCRPFDHRADGTVPADAVGAVVLRRLEDAIRDKDRIYAVVSGIAIGSDGNVDKAGYNIPSPRGQAELIKRAWDNAGLHPSKLTYAELHGSGTSLGDALELEGMHLARKEMGLGDTPFTAGSNKGNFGNTGAASGIVSVIKMCKSIQHGVIPPIQSFEKIHPMVNPEIPVKIANEAIPLPPNAVVSVTGIGLGGVNAHCIISTP